MPATEFKNLINIILSNPAYSKGLLEPIDFAPRYLLNRFLEYLSPDSKRYYSVLNPIFSMELEYSPDNRIEQVNVVFLRDGVMPLLKFFILNPAPFDPGPLLIIDQNLSALVPESWRNKVLLRVGYHKTSETSESSEFSGESKKLFFISPIELSTPMDLIETELAFISDHIQEGDELLFYFSSASLRGREHSVDDKVWGYKILEKIMTKFRANPIRILDWKEYVSLDLSDVKYYFINPLQYFFTDSFLFHDAAQRGAKPLMIEAVSTLGNSFMYEVSHYHGFVIHQNFESYQSYGVENLAGLIFELSMSDKDKKISPRTLNLASEEFKDWAQDVARDLYVKNSHKNAQVPIY
ncbi:MAG: hypothetical protein H7336_04140 [Bacteriovorax sp.]|nr:hypothetical protein [Bacteriovorax sp.]